ncbi:MAG: hypothetical protein JSR46_08885 [Verrucomicrobia bacterium]|nr:hypothetical protein [Verrucomicrobiota bacterium]
MSVSADSKDLCFKECLIQRNSQVNEWKKAIDAELEKGLATEVASRIETILTETIRELSDANYSLPTEKSKLILTFSFDILRGFCKEFTESLADDSIIKKWVDLVKQSQTERKTRSMLISEAYDKHSAYIETAPAKPLKLNYEAWNTELEKVTEKTKAILQASLDAIKKKNEVDGKAFLELAVRRPGLSKSHGCSVSESSTEFENKLEISFWTPSANTDPNKKEEAPTNSPISKAVFGQNWGF